MRGHTTVIKRNKAGEYFWIERKRGKQIWHGPYINLVKAAEEAYPEYWATRKGDKYNAIDVAHAINCKYTTTLFKLIRAGYRKFKDQRGYYSFTEKQFNKVVKQLSQPGT